MAKSTDFILHSWIYYVHIELHVQEIFDTVVHMFHWQMPQYSWEKTFFFWIFIGRRGWRRGSTSVLTLSDEIGEQSTLLILYVYNVLLLWLKAIVEGGWDGHHFLKSRKIRVPLKFRGKNEPATTHRFNPIPFLTSFLKISGNTHNDFWRWIMGVSINRCRKSSFSSKYKNSRLLKVHCQWIKALLYFHNQKWFHAFIGSYISYTLPCGGETKITNQNCSVGKQVLTVHTVLEINVILCTFADQFLKNYSPKENY
mgnify:CR=1 FL=1